MTKTIHDLVKFPDEQIDSLSREEADEFFIACHRIKETASKILVLYQNAHPNVVGTAKMIKIMETESDDVFSINEMLPGETHRFFPSSPGSKGYILKNEGERLQLNQQEAAGFYLEYHTLKDKLAHKESLIENRLGVLRVEQRLDN